MKKTTKRRKKEKESFFGLYIILCTIFGIAFSFFGLGIFETYKINKSSYMNDLIVAKEDNVKKYASINIYTIPYGFAEYEGSEGRFYIVKDADYLYIVYLNEKQFNQITKKLQKEPYKLKGYTNTIPKEIKELAIDSYNSLLDYNEVTEDNFDSFFGTIYLDATATNNLSILYYVLSGVFIVLGSITIIIINKGNRRNACGK